MLEGFESSTCFLPQITPGTYRLLDVNRHWNNGRYLASGSLMDQPAVYMEAMEFIDNERSRLETKLARILAEKARKGQK